MTIIPTERKERPSDLLEKLEAPLPAEAVSPNPERPGLSVIKVIYDDAGEGFQIGEVGTTERR